MVVECVGRSLSYIFPEVVNMKIHLEQVIVTHRASWNADAWHKWPEIEDRDYSEILARRWTTEFEIDGTTFVVTNRFYPAYLPYIKTGTQPPTAFPEINNTRSPSSEVLEVMAADLSLLGKECQVILWEHAYQCYPEIAHRLCEWFKLSILKHGDDCPAVSPIRTLPVCAGFDALYYQMFIYDSITGQLTKDAYAIHGLMDCRFKSSNESVGLQRWIADNGFKIEDKLEQVRQGTVPVGFVWVGASSMGCMRDHVLQNLYTSRSRISEIVGPVAMHSKHNLDGPLHPLDHQYGEGYVVAELYARSLFGFNGPVSSIFNTRTIDLPLLGVAPVVLDPHNELKREGFLPNEHYIPFDYDLDKMLSTWKQRPNDLAELIEKSHQKTKTYLRERSTNRVFAEIYRDYVSRFE